MPLLLILGAIAVVILLMAVGWRRGWDPTPQDLPPVTLKTARQTSSSMKFPRWYWPIALASFPALVLLVYLSEALDQRWITKAGLVLFAASWAVRTSVPLWITAESRTRQVVAVVRPLIVLLAVVLAGVTGWGWWLLPGGVAFMAILPLSDAYERHRRGRITEPASAAPGPDDTRR